MKRPEFCKPEHLHFLDDLRDSGITNMLGAAPYLIETFEVTRHEAKKILLYWMKTYSARVEAGDVW